MGQLQWAIPVAALNERNITFTLQDVSKDTTLPQPPGSMLQLCGNSP